MKFFVIAVATGATGIATKGLEKYLETILGKHSVNSLQKNSCTRDFSHNKRGVTT
jgi:hypothetical protein